jgi:FixJ family two-component response regulator
MANEFAKFVAVVDDEELLRNSLGAVLASSGHNVSTYESGAEFLSALSASIPSCIFLDVRMPGMQGIEVLENIRQIQPTVPVVMMSGFADVAMAVKAMQSGASDFIEKPFNSKDILDTLTKVVAQSQNSDQAHAVNAQASKKISNLTKREKQVLGCLVQGMQNKVVARELGISPRTVEVHRARIMERLNLASFAELVRLAVLAGFEVE